MHYDGLIERLQTGLDVEELSLATLLERHPCPAELLVPFRLEEPKVNNWFAACVATQYKAMLWNMDLPIILGLLISWGLGVVFIVVLLSLQELGFQRFFAMPCVAPLILVGPWIVYALCVTTNLRLGYGRRWWTTLLAPTNIGLTDSGFKVYFRGRLFYNYPQLALWAEIYEVELLRNRLGEPVISLSYKSAMGHQTVTLPLRGFCSTEDLNLFLQSLAKRTDAASQSSAFIEAIQDSFAKQIAEYEQQREVSGAYLLADRLS